jgi:type 1 fimbria pilin
VDLRQAAGTQNDGTAATITSNPTFTYNAAYVATATGVSAGSVSTSVQYNLVYQ